VGKKLKKGRWPVEQRLEFIDFRLYWEGHINRGDLVSFFGVSVPQASSDLAEYQRTANGNAVYDKTRKTYVSGRKFKPVFFKPSADDYLAQLRLIQAGLLAETEAWAVRLPSYSIVPILRRRLEANTLRRILDAIRTRAAIHIHYQSKSSPQPKWRWIAPHSLGFDGFRWHARAWCDSRKAFLDFVLARILEVGEARPDGVDPSADIGWEREVTLRLAPHPGLKGGHRRAVELDFGMTNGLIEVTMRVCLAYYFIFQLGLDSEPEGTDPASHELVLVNRNEVEAAIKKAGRC
jgi:WYL domain